ncbi:hypothetical protein IWY39_000596 [Sphingobium sp. JAI105]|uniref:hypothetical protein n=1 Tax=Sphingobium sp. JAI105 TaxID=2787715 RepID=UPI0018C8DBCC|nr:hypothetical protein [Sphingobium sp. JAI105]MBG6116792.1 hypothetical protein [Sphingobium sp. JAI105]
MNPLRGEVPLVLGDVTLTLKLGINALCVAEPMLGRKARAILDDMEDDRDGPALDTIRVLTWAGLRKHHADYHLIQIGELMEEFGPAVFSNAILASLESAFGSGEGKKGENPPKPTRRKRTGTG